MTSLNDLREQAPRFVSSLRSFTQCRFVLAVLAWLKSNKVDVANLFLDHLCYRVSTLKEYEEWKEQLIKSNAQLLIESMMGGRLISTFKLSEPILLLDTLSAVEPIHRRIDILELPSPKPNRHYDSGLEHVEFALLPCSMSPHEALRDKEPLQHFISAYPHLNWNIDGLNKEVNGDVRLDFVIQPQQQPIKASVKFHVMDLETVIALEKT